MRKKEREAIVAELKQEMRDIFWKEIEVLNQDVPHDEEETDQWAGAQKEPEILNTRAQILREAEELINGDRAQTYGDPEVSFGRIADIWTAAGYRKHEQVLGEAPGITRANKLDAIDAAFLLIGLKYSRMIGSHGRNRDDWVDLSGYSGLGGELALPVDGLGGEINDQA